MSGRLQSIRRLAVELARGIVAEWRSDRITGLAAEIAFWTVLSLVPLAIALGASLQFIEPLAGRDAADTVRRQLLAWAGDVLGRDGGAAEALGQLFEQSGTGALTFGVLVAFWSSARGFGAVIGALDVVYDLDEHRSFIAQRINALVLAVGSVITGAVILSMLVFGPLLGSGSDIADAVGLGRTFAALWTYLRLPFALAVMVAWAATVFHVAPNHRTPWRWDLPGAAMTTVLWLLGSFGFRVYLGVAGSGSNAVLGVLGGTLTLLLFVFVLALSLLVGGEVNALLSVRYDVARWQPPARRLRRFVHDRWPVADRSGSDRTGSEAGDG